VNLRSDDKAINICYILIKTLETQPASTLGRKGDVNLDGDVNIADAVVMQSYLLAKTQITGEQAYAADVLSDTVPNVFDMILLKQIVAGS
ncbi:MAG TPA: dockerin type I repeat-containing protein, partial [Ruminococcus sp.]|nr:dockerin type I repeat-containing protein [Ruminococcus sp.]